MFFLWHTLSSQNVIIFFPRVILTAFRKTVFYSHRHFLKQTRSLQNPKPHCAMLISSFSHSSPSIIHISLYNPHFHFQVSFPMILIKHSHSGLLKRRPLYCTSVVSIYIFLRMASSFKALSKC